MAQARKSKSNSTITTPAAGISKTDGKPAQQQAAPAARAAKPTNGATPQVQMVLNHDQIAQRAFAIWVAKGKPQGQELQNWTDAENQLRQELARRA